MLVLILLFLKVGCVLAQGCMKVLSCAISKPSFRLPEQIAV